MTDSDPSTKKRTTRAKPPERLTLADLDRIVLKSGGHERRALDALCVMEAVAWLAGREHTDHPPCVSTTIGAFLRSWNDTMNDGDRQILKPLIPQVIGTAGTLKQELQRSWMALDWYCRVSAPAWLRLAGLVTEAQAIEATAPIIDSASAKAAQASLNTARDAARKAWAAAWAVAGAAAGAAWDAAWDAAGAAAGAAAWAAAWDAAGAAARAAAGAAAWDAAKAAAGAAAGAAAWDAAWDAAKAAAWDAAWDAAKAAAGAAAWDAAGAAAKAAAWDAAGEKLRPTIKTLQASAVDLVERMIAVTSAAQAPETAS
jgi:hypothetical protein